MSWKQAKRKGLPQIQNEKIVWIYFENISVAAAQ